MSYRVRLTDAAQADLERRILSLAERSAGMASRLNDRFEQALVRLRDFPLSCGLAHESSEFPEDVRHLLFWTHAKWKYRALFVVRDEEAVILAIRAPGEKPVRPEDVEIQHCGPSFGGARSGCSGGSNWETRPEERLPGMEGAPVR